MNRIKELRVRAGMQQKELAIALGIAHPTVSEWEHQKKDPSGDRLRKLSEIFGVSIGVILCYDPIPGVAQTSNDLTPAECEMLSAWRAADEVGQISALRILLASRRADRAGGIA